MHFDAVSNWELLRIVFITQLHQANYEVIHIGLQFGSQLV